MNRSRCRSVASLAARWWPGSSASAIVLLAGLVVNLDGGVMPPRELFLEGDPVLEFGWPAQYATRIWNNGMLPHDDSGRWILFPFTGTQEHGVLGWDSTFSLGWAVWNAGVVLALAIVCGVTAARAASRSEVAQTFGLQQLLALVGFFASVFAIVHVRDRYDAADIVRNVACAVLWAALAIAWLGGVSICMRWMGAEQSSVPDASSESSR